MYKTHGFIKDLDKGKLLEMREAGMSNKEIAVSQECSAHTIWELIGAQPKEMTRANRSKAVTETNTKRGVLACARRTRLCILRKRWRL